MNTMARGPAVTHPVVSHDHLRRRATTHSGRAARERSGHAVATPPPVHLVGIPARKRKVLPVETTSHAFAYVFAGAGNASQPLAVPTEPAGWADPTPPAEADNRTLVLFDRGEEIEIEAGADGVRFLLVSGQPLGEPVPWYGPIVMNTQEELRHAFAPLKDGSFLRPMPRDNGRAGPGASRDEPCRLHIRLLATRGITSANG
jgi:redox-sensitive bicupin YhaK (pirin superfamily)